MTDPQIRATWDTLAATGNELYVGESTQGAEELDRLFERLGANPRGGVCVEVGCGHGRMTPLLARRFDRVIALDVSPAMLARTQQSLASAGVDNVELAAVSGERLDPVPDRTADVLVCYRVLTHLPRKELQLALFSEFSRVLVPGGEALVQLPVLEPGLRSRAWRLFRSLAVPVIYRLTGDASRHVAYRGSRVTERELATAIKHAGLLVRSRDDSTDYPYRYSRDVYLRLERAA